MYAELASIGMKMVMGIGQGVLADAEVNAANTISEANAAANNLIRAANNRLKGARSSLARFTQSVNNQRVLENTAGAVEAATVNYRRQRDAGIQDNIESQIALSEQAGAQAAASAFSGLSGGVADIVRGTTALRKARMVQRKADAIKGMDYDAAQRTKTIMQAGWDSLDHSEIAADIDYSRDVAVTRNRGGNFLSDMLGGVDTKDIANVTSFFSKSTFDAFADRAGPTGSGSGGRSRTITGGR